MNLRSALTATTAALALTAGASGAMASDYYVSVFGGVSTNGDEPHFAGLTNTASTRTAFLYVYTQIYNNIPYGKYGTYLDVYLGLHLGSGLYGTSKFAWNDDFDDGFVVGAALGQDFGGWRAELEFAYRTFDVANGTLASNNFDGRSSYIYGYGTLYYVVKLGGGTTVGGFNTGFYGTTPGSQYWPFTVNLPYNTTIVGNVPTDGSLDVWSFMANIWLDFDPFNVMPDNAMPFIGGGVGAARLDFEHRMVGTTLLGSSISFTTTGDDVVLAYQLGGGINFEFDNGMMLSAQYRYFGSADADIGGVTDVKMDSHNAIVSLSFPLNMLN